MSDRNNVNARSFLTDLAADMATLLCEIAVKGNDEEVEVIASRLADVREGIAAAEVMRDQILARMRNERAARLAAFEANGANVPLLPRQFPRPYEPLSERLAATSISYTWS